MLKFGVKLLFSSLLFDANNFNFLEKLFEYRP